MGGEKWLQLRLRVGGPETFPAPCTPEEGKKEKPQEGFVSHSSRGARSSVARVQPEEDTSERVKRMASGRGLGRQAWGLPQGEPTHMMQDSKHTSQPRGRQDGLWTRWWAHKSPWLATKL